MLKAPLRELSLALVGDARMAELHERYMDIPGPTDVLTFPLDQDEHGRVTHGEVIVCVPEARRRAGEHGVPLRSELLLYGLHGMLHLCGHDDRTARGYQKMHRTEDRILTALGIGPTFEPDARSAKKSARSSSHKMSRRRASAKRSRA
jgi:probable rRNA maturation factor